MTQISTSDASNGTTADAGLVNSNFSNVKSAVNGNLDNANISSTAAITVSKLAPGTDSQVLTTTAGVVGWAASSSGASTVPSGSMFLYGGSSAPSGFLLCDGTAVSRSTYSALFTAIGTAYGAGDGSTTFATPDLRGRVPAGKGTNGYVSTLGNNDGLAESSRSPYHSHSFSVSANRDLGIGQGNPGSVVAGSQSSTTGTATPSYMTVNYIIKT